MNDGKETNVFNPGLEPGPKPERGGMLKRQAKARVKKSKASTTIEPREVRVASWAPSKLEALSQVHVVIKTGKGFDFVLRLKSRAVCEEMIRALVSHRDDVWGAEEDLERKHDRATIHNLKTALEAYRTQTAQADVAIRLLLDSVDYLAGNCTANEMVGAALPKEIIMRARQTLALKAEPFDPATGTGAFLANPPYGEKGE